MKASITYKDKPILTGFAAAAVVYGAVVFPWALGLAVIIVESGTWIFGQ